MKNKDTDTLIDKALAHLWRHGSTLSATEANGGPIAVRGEGVRITTADGTTYLDGLSGGSAAATLGYGRTDVVDAVASQMGSLHWTSFRAFLNEPAIELAAEIADLSGGALVRTAFVNSGSEAVETAAQMVKAYHRQKGQASKSKVLYRTTGFHGVGLVAASANTSPGYRNWFEPLVPGFIEVPTCYAYRCAFGRSPEECGEPCAQAVEDAILHEGPETVGAIFAEAIPAAIILPPAPGYLRRLREICDKYDVLWVDDEVFIGFGRTGKYFGFEHYDVVPDIVTASKGLTAGYVPLGAVMASERVSEVLVGDGSAGQAVVHGHTYSGHAACCAGGLAVLRALREEQLIEHVADVSAGMFTDYERFAVGHPNVGDVRGKGFLVGIELVADKATKTPFPKEFGVGKKIVATAREQGLLCRSAAGDIVGQSGDFTTGDIITLFPAFVSTKDDVEQMTSIVTGAIEKVCSQLPAS